MKKNRNNTKKNFKLKNRNNIVRNILILIKNFIKLSPSLKTVILILNNIVLCNTCFSYTNEKPTCNWMK